MMSAPYLHIVALNIPYPDDYGGVIETFHKIRALKQAGAMVILHCFEYGRQPSKELEDLCFKVYYYPRRSGMHHLLRPDPYIVSTRTANNMPDNLIKDPFPVLFDGIHTTGQLEAYRAAGKKVLVRAHNIEHRYYRALAQSERRLGQKLYLYRESRKLERYEAILSRADHILAISRDETEYFQERYGNAIFIPAFHRFEEVVSAPGTGDYILYHGNLGISENSGILLKLLRGPLARSRYRIVIAGKNPGKKLKQVLSGVPGAELVADPSEEVLDNLIRNAQVNLLYTLQNTGMKLKLIHALFAGRHCLVNAPMVAGTGLESLCEVSDLGEGMIRDLHRLMEKPFSDEQIRERKKALLEYSNRAGAEKILRLIS